jgi:hypothetical protein
MAKKKNPIVFMDVSIGDEPDERMFFEREKLEEGSLKLTGRMFHRIPLMVAVF